MIIAINIVFKKLKNCPTSDLMQIVMLDFKNWCKMPNIMGAMDGTHINIAKLPNLFLNDYYYHKTRGYDIIVQVVVDSQKRFLVVLWGCLGM
jgi:hypothetical protein